VRKRPAIVPQKNVRIKVSESEASIFFAIRSIVMDCLFAVAMTRKAAPMIRRVKVLILERRELSLR